MPAFNAFHDPKQHNRKKRVSVRARARAKFRETVQRFVELGQESGETDPLKIVQDAVNRATHQLIVMHDRFGAFALNRIARGALRGA
jgi:hypothetical protein